MSITFVGLIFLAFGFAVIAFIALGKIVTTMINSPSRVRCGKCGHRQPSCIDEGWHYGHCKVCGYLIEDYR